MAQGQVRVIQIKVVSDSDKVFRKIKSSVDQTAKSINGMSNSLDIFKRIYFAVIAGRGVSYLKELADGWQLNRDRIKNFTGSAEAALKVQNDLYQVAQRNRTDIDSLGESFNRLGFATKDLKLNSKELVNVLDLLDLTFKVSGSNAQEQANSMIQLAQGLGAGALRGDEFRSVAEQNVVLLGLLSKELGVSNGRLKDMAAEGKITSDVVLKALVNNADDLRRQFENINPTLEQTGVTLRNFVGKSLDAINRQFGITATISTVAGAALAFVGENAEEVGMVIKGIAFSLLPALTLGIVNATIAMKGFTASNPILLAVSVTLGVVAAYWEDIYRWLQLASNTLDSWLIKFRKWTNSWGGKGFTPDKEAIKRDEKTLADIAKKRENLLKKFADEDKANQAKMTGFSMNSDDVDSFYKKIDEAQKKMALGKKNKFKFLNLSDSINDLDEYKRKLKELELVEIKDQFKDGKIHLIEYTDKLKDLEYKYRELESSQNQALMGMRRGLDEYAKSARDMGENFKNFISGTFSSLEDQLVQFVTKGKFEFKQFADAVIADLARIAVRQSITAPLAAGLSSFFAPSGAPAASSGPAGASPSISGDVMLNAKGNVFNSGRVQAFASGGVVNSPTYFPMKNGLGLMGEAGPEAIMPLTRGADGKLGVKASGGSSKVTVNVINQSGGQVETKEREGANGEREIEVLILGTVERGITSGRLDKSMSSTYGVRRKGGL